jgi:hypothetical protein
MAPVIAGVTSYLLNQSHQDALHSDIARLERMVLEKADAEELRRVATDNTNRLDAVQRDLTILAKRPDSIPITNTSTTETGQADISDSTRQSQSNANFSGKWEWTSGWGRVRIRQKPDGAVEGEYTEGTLKGDVSGHTMQFTWRGRSQEGTAYARLDTKTGIRVISGRHCYGLGCDPDDPRQDNTFTGRESDW